MITGSILRLAPSAVFYLSLSLVTACKVSVFNRATDGHEISSILPYRVARGNKVQYV